MGLVWFGRSLLAINAGKVDLLLVTRLLRVGRALLFQISLSGCTTTADCKIE